MCSKKRFGFVSNSSSSSFIIQSMKNISNLNPTGIAFVEYFNYLSDDNFNSDEPDLTITNDEINNLITKHSDIIKLNTNIDLEEADYTFIDTIYSLAFKFDKYRSKGNHNINFYYIPKELKNYFKRIQKIMDKVNEYRKCDYVRYYSGACDTNRKWKKSWKQRNKYRNLYSYYNQRNHSRSDCVEDANNLIYSLLFEEDCIKLTVVRYIIGKLIEKYGSEICVFDVGNETIDDDDSYKGGYLEYHLWRNFKKYGILGGESFH